LNVRFGNEADYQPTSAPFSSWRQAGVCRSDWSNAARIGPRTRADTQPVRLAYDEPMNIFDALSRGNSRIHEVGITSILSYFLDPTADHGLGDSFLRATLRALNPDRFAEILAGPALYATVEPEKPYKDGKGSQFFIDIEVRLFSSDEKAEELHRILIENKIAKSTLRQGQLASYHTCVMAEDDFKSAQPSLSIFLIAPASAKGTAEQEVKSLATPDLLCRFVPWDGESGSVVAVIRGLLDDEHAGRIRPIAEYSRHTLKALTYHLATQFQPVSRTVRARGESEGTVEVTIEGKVYQLSRYDNGSIELVNEKGEKEVVKPLLRLLNEEMALGVKPEAKSGKLLNTQQLGRKILEALKARDRFAWSEGDLTDVVLSPAAAAKNQTG
jgi:hypothetical protein